MHYCTILSFVWFHPNTNSICLRISPFTAWATRRRNRHALTFHCLYLQYLQVSSSALEFQHFVHDALWFLHCTLHKHKSALLFWWSLYHSFTVSMHFQFYISKVNAADPRYHCWSHLHLDCFQISILGAQRSCHSISHWPITDYRSHSHVLWFILAIELPNAQTCLIFPYR